MSGCQACQFEAQQQQLPQQQAPQCASTSTATAGPCAAPSYARACLAGDPSKSPLYIERQARKEHLWQRGVTVTVGAGGAGSIEFVDVLYPAFTSSGNACLRSVSLIATLAGDTTAVAVNVVGVAGVWDFTDSTAEWTERVAIPCEAITDDIITTTGRCPCKVDCEGCLYPEGVGGQFMVRYKFDAITLAVGDTLVFKATGEHTPSAPCCVLPQYLAEDAARTTNITGFVAGTGNGIIQSVG